MGLKRMDNVGIAVDDLGGTIDFLRELGLELEGRATIEGEWAGRVTGLGDQRVEIAMMRTPDGHGRLELSRFLTPPAVADHRNAPVNALAVRGKNKVFSGGAKEVGLLKCGDKIAYFASQSGMESSPASPNRPEPRKFAPQKLKNLQTKPL